MAVTQPATKRIYTRRRGVLLPIFSLPEKYGVGTLGKEAEAFIDILSECGASIWAILPTGVTGFGDSPYQSFSSFALNPYFLDLDSLIEEGLLTVEECGAVDFGSDPSAVDYGKLYENRLPLLMTAYARAVDRPGYDEEMKEFEAASPWLDDFALFTAIKEHEGGRPWYEWPEGLKHRDPEAIEKIREKISCEIGFHKFIQMKLSEGWERISQHALGKGVLIMGDLPIYCAYDSADCWAYRRNFRFDADGRPTEVAGVPPDYFCEDGQLWGNPVYDWRFMREDGFSFWMRRLSRAAELYDILRIDHFRGFAGYYAVPAGAPNARRGVWRRAYGGQLFEKVKERGFPLEIVAEDLGFITGSVKKLLKDTGFAFDEEPGNPHRNKKWNGDPAKIRNKVAYTGTHDNPTLVEWWEEQDERTRAIAEKYTGTDDLPRGIIKAAVGCDARYVIIPAQDVLGKGPGARINTPGTASGNWVWRMRAEEKAPFAEELKKLFD